jgi:nucleotide sugar dehydrogenase
MFKVLVVGLGTIGYATATYLSRFHKVYGFDIMPKQASEFQIVSSINEVEPNIYVVCVPTDQVEKACAEIPRKDHLVLIESTVQVGTCYAVAQKFGFTHVAHCPHRYWPEQAEKHGVNEMRVLGAVNHESGALAVTFYEASKIPVIIVSNVETAEASKLVENAYRFVKIAFSEEMRMLCSDNGLCFNELREAVNTKWNTYLMEARDGIGGTCLPKDIRLLASIYGREGVMAGAIKADEDYKRENEK